MSNKNKDFEMFHENLKTGRFNECLNEIKRLENSCTRIPEENFIIQNNKIVCECLACDGDWRKSCEAADSLLLLYDNCVLTAAHSEIFLQVQLALLYNTARLLIATSKNLDYQKVIDRFIKMCSRICRGLTGERSQMTQQEAFQVKLSAKKTLIAARMPDVLPLFTEMINMILLHLLPSTAHHHINQFAKNYLKDSMEMTALSTGSSSDRLPTAIIDWNGSPSCLSNIDMEQPLGLMEVISFSTNSHQNVSMPESCRSSAKSKWQWFQLYIAAYRAHLKGEDNQALHFALIAHSTSSSGVLLANLHLLLGQIYSNLRERHKAIENFEHALRILKQPIAFYYLGRELSKLGIYDSMLKSYQNLVKLITRRQKINSSMKSLEEILLDSIHHNREISRPSALYALAVGYGINEMFEEASVLFEEITRDCNVAQIIDDVTSKKGVIEIPHIATVMHEAATIFLLTGKLHKAQLAIGQAMQAYPQMPVTRTDLHGSQDNDLIRNILQDGFNIDLYASLASTKYYEDYLCTFEEDVIGLMILAEIQSISGSSDARLTINQVLVILSKYMAKIQREKSEANKPQMDLVNALTSKTCLHVAKMLSSSGNFTEVNKMFKRALSCNNADKDGLYHYAEFLIASGKISDAEKLWNTFGSKESNIHLNEIQSLALRHLLRTQTTTRQISDLLKRLSSQAVQ